MKDISQILLLKLKRNKISYRYTKQTLEIGRQQYNFLVWAFLVILPSLSGVLTVFLLFYFRLSPFDNLGAKGVALVLFFFGTAVTTIIRQVSLTRANRRKVTLSDNLIRIEEKHQNLVFRKTDLLSFQYKIEGTGDGFIGKLLIEDTKFKSHLLFALHDDNRQLLEDDLHWVCEYLSDYFEIAEDELFRKVKY